jgi:hypothetical protein
MDTVTTCGQGLATTAELPDRLGQVLGALSDVLANHVLAIQLDDAHGEQEREAYQSLVGEFTPLAERVQLVARQMAGYRDLPAARHEVEALADPMSAKVFERFVTAEEALFHLLRLRLEEDRRMLAEMRSA